MDADGVTGMFEAIGTRMDGVGVVGTIFILKTDELDWGSVGLLRKGL